MADAPSMFEAPYRPAPDALPSDEYIRPNLSDGLRIWWAFFWRTTLASTVLTIATTVALRKIYEDAYGPTCISTYILVPLMKYNQYLFTYGVALLVMAYILRKNFRDFRIGLLSHQGIEPRQILRPTAWRTIRVWWTYSWRSLVYYLIAWVVVILPLTWFIGLFGPPRLFAPIFVAALGIVIGGAVGLFVIYSNLLDEDIGDFRIALLPRHTILPAATTATSSVAAN